MRVCQASAQPPPKQQQLASSAIVMNMGEFDIVREVEEEEEENGFDFNDALEMFF